MIHAKLSTWLYSRMLENPEYRYVEHYRWKGQIIVVFSRYKKGEGK